ncbi:hypothetical protein [Frigidibacter sp. ROC022]|uniref:hypothetical protein n=1 Tax=Frigidibacter sp. ROC022 TaxID=2971796 RepID=UPI00215B3A13|nr:hypothetical protein [Frigidibacter sp. ROC022]MCR8726303.1 hypothetical protein [Frigidibacter sp. ROC022]
MAVYRRRYHVAHRYLVGRLVCWILELLGWVIVAAGCLLIIAGWINGEMVVQFLDIADTTGPRFINIVASISGGIIIMTGLIMVAVCQYFVATFDNSMTTQKLLVLAEEEASAWEDEESS